jgi:O-antigen/teichoic acid export membrane protein
MAHGEMDHLLRTEHLAPDLRSRSVRGGLAVATAQATQFALGLISTVVLARLLVPADFGLVAMVAAVGNFLLVFLDLGLGSATVQRADLTRAQVGALFWINVAVGLVLAAVMAGSAPLVARFYGRPELIGVTQALALGIVFGGLSVQHTALLNRQMRFGSLAVVSVISQALGIAAAIASAVAGAGYWALVLLQLVQQACAAAGAWAVCGWTPGRPARSSGVRRLLSFGVGLTGFNLLTALARNLDDILIGRVSGTIALGLYLKSYALLLLPVDRIRGPASAVVVPALSRLQDDPIRFRAYYHKAIRSVVAVGMPAVVFLFVFANEVILLALGDQWRGSIVLFQALAPAAFVETFNTVGSWACTPLGRTGRLVRWQIFATSVMVLSFLVGIRWGALGVAAAFSFSTVALRLPAILFLLEGSPVRPRDLLLALARPACASLSAGVILFALRTGIPPGVDRALVLLAAAMPFAALYLGVWLMLPGGRQDVRELVAMLNGVLPRRGGAGAGEMGG